MEIRKMRRSDREMDKNGAIDVVDKCAYAVMAVTLPESGPYCVPLSIARKNEYVYFHCTKEGAKIDALKADPRVCITCVGAVEPRKNEFSTVFESAMIFGKAESVENDDEKLMALRIISEKYCPENMHVFEEYAAKSFARTAVWRIKIEHITGKQKKYGPDGRELKKKA